jgi:hypothetical protein
MHEVIRAHARTLANRLDSDSDRDQVTAGWITTSTPPSVPARLALPPAQQWMDRLWQR